MFFGSLLRLSGFAIGAGLTFLLSPQDPVVLNWPHQEQLSVWQDARAAVFKGLRRVKADLESAREDGDRGQFSALGAISAATETGLSAIARRGHGREKF